jgi:hypothetical protein
VKDFEVREILLTTIATGTPEQVASAKVTLAKLDGPPEPQEITGNITLGEGPMRTRHDGTTYRQWSSLIVSAEYAKALVIKFGRLSPEAAEFAAGERLLAAAGTDDKAGFLEKFPDSQAFWDDAKDRLKKFYSEIDAQSKTLKAKQEATPVVEQHPAPVKAAGTETIPPMQPMSVVDRALVLRALGLSR